MNTAALKCPLQVAKAQWTIPVSNTIGATFFEKVLDFMEDFRCFQYFYFRNNFFLLQAGVTVSPFALQAEGVKAEWEDLSISEDGGEAGVLGGEEGRGEAIRPNSSTQQPVAPILCVQDGQVLLNHLLGLLEG